MALTLWIVVSPRLLVYLSGRDRIGGALAQKRFSFVLFILGVGLVFFFNLEIIFLFFPSFPFAQELQTGLISKKLLFSVSRDAHAPQMRNSGKCLARMLNKRMILHAYS